MNMLIQRETLHQLIDTVPENQLSELIDFVTQLLEKTYSLNAYSFATDRAAIHETDESLEAIVQNIKNAPPNPQAIMLPQKAWDDYVKEMDTLPPLEEIENIEIWNHTWDKIEAEMEARSLLHERKEFTEEWL